jgi:hypothetical protein
VILDRKLVWARASERRDCMSHRLNEKMIEICQYHYANSLYVYLMMHQDV